MWLYFSLYCVFRLAVVSNTTTGIKCNLCCKKPIKDSTVQCKMKFYLLIVKSNKTLVLPFTLGARL